MGTARAQTAWQRLAFAAVGPLAVVLALTFLLWGATAGPIPSRSPFAGYSWQGSVRSVRGSWTVPRIIGGSAPEVAATWIGAQAPGSSGPFIQIGTNEQRVNSSLLPFASTPSTYYAFWSYTAHDFRPVNLFPVNPGDDLAASMTLGRKGWTVAIADQSTGENARVTTAQEAHGSFNQAEWTQEDATDRLTGEPFPYPPLSTVSFSRLAVNSTTPGLGDMASTAMSENGNELTPGPLHDDSFTLHQVTLRLAGRHGHAA